MSVIATIGMTLVLGCERGLSDARAGRQKTACSRQHPDRLRFRRDEALVCEAGGGDASGSEHNECAGVGFSANLRAIIRPSKCITFHNARAHTA